MNAIYIRHGYKVIAELKNIVGLKGYNLYLYDMKYLVQFSLWVLRKAKYKFKIVHDEFKIEIFPVGIDETSPTRYDFVCNKKGRRPEFLSYIEMTRYFDPENMFDCPNPLIKGIRFNDEYKVYLLEEAYNKLIRSVITSAKIVI